MCCTIDAQTRLSDTTIYSAEVLREGRPVHVIGYQNTIETWSRGPGAMILPIPSDGPVGPENVVDATEFKGVLKGYAEAIEHLKPRMRSMDRFTKGGDSFAMNSLSRGITFNSGSYTVALANTAEGLASALVAVPDNRRPQIPEPILTSLAQLYPGWPIAVCCYDGNEVKGKVEPIFWWFEPKEEFKDTLFAPAIDAHDGNPPNIDRKHQVPRDHTLIFGSYRSEKHRHVAETQLYISRVPEQDRWMFTPSVAGTIMQNRPTRNGDFVLPIDYLMSNHPSYIGSDQINVRVPGV